MPTIGHLAVGLLGARVGKRPPRVSLWVWAAILVAVSFAPDLDVLGLRLGIPYEAPFGHRGAFHSPVFAALCGIVVGGLVWAARGPAVLVAVTVAVVMASHGVLDAFTDGGKGLALLWPLSDDRFFAPWRPIPVAPLGLGMLSRRGAAVVLQEMLLFLPLLVVALWPWRFGAGKERAVQRGYLDSSVKRKVSSGPSS